MLVESVLHTTYLVVSSANLSLWRSGCMKFIAGPATTNQTPSVMGCWLRLHLFCQHVACSPLVWRQTNSSFMCLRGLEVDGHGLDANFREQARGSHCQRSCCNRSFQVKKIYETVGVYLGYALAGYCDPHGRVRDHVEILPALASIESIPIKEAPK